MSDVSRGPFDPASSSMWRSAGLNMNLRSNVWWLLGSLVCAFFALVNVSITIATNDQLGYRAPLVQALIYSSAAIVLAMVYFIRRKTAIRWLFLLPTSLCLYVLADIWARLPYTFS